MRVIIKYFLGILAITSILAIVGLDAVQIFRDINNHTDLEVVQLARNDQLDIAIDLMAFTEKNRFGIWWIIRRDCREGDCFN